MSISIFGLNSNRRGGASAEEPLDSFFSDSLIFPSSLPDHPGHSHSHSHSHDVAAAANTQVDWKETADAHVFKANLPGLGKQEVKVQVDEERVLQISGKRKKEETSPSDRWHRVERSHGSFLRRFKLPKNTKVDQVKAAMENGVLTVTVPKTAPPKPKSNVRTIEIS